MADFDNPTYERDETFIDDQAPLLPDTSAQDELPSVPYESAGTLDNNEARQELYGSLRKSKWYQDPGDIDKEALLRHGAAIHKDKSTGKAYVRYRGKNVLLTKVRGSGFLGPDTIAGKCEKPRAQRRPLC